MQKGFDYLFEKTDQLPSEIAEIVLAFNFTGGFTEVANKYKLHIDQAEILEDLTFRVMFGDIDGTIYTSRLSSDLALPAATAKELAQDTDLRIVAPVKNEIMKYIEEEAQYYKNIELDAPIQNEDSSIPSPEAFHPKSAYNEPITNDAPQIHPITPIHGTKLTHSDVLHGIENPHPSVIFNSPIKTASGSKSYADIMGVGTNTVKTTVPEAPKEPIAPIEPTPKPTPIIAQTPPQNLQQKIDLISMKSSSVVVSAPNKIETLPTKPADNLPVLKSIDPYKENI